MKFKKTICFLLVFILISTSVLLFPVSSLAANGKIVVDVKTLFHRVVFIGTGDLGVFRATGDAFSHCDRVRSYQNYGFIPIRVRKKKSKRTNASIFRDVDQDSPSLRLSKLGENRVLIQMIGHFQNYQNCFEMQDGRAAVHQNPFHDEDPQYLLDAQVEGKFVEGSWAAFEAGESVKIEPTEQGYLDFTNQLSLCIVGASEQLRANMSRLGSVGEPRVKGLRIRSLVLVGNQAEIMATSSGFEGRVTWPFRGITLR